MGTTSRNARMQLLFVVLAVFVLEAHARPDFDRAGAGSELRRRRPPYSPQEPLRFKQSLRVLSTNGDVLHVGYDVTRFNSTRVLDEMDSVHVAVRQITLSQSSFPLDIWPSSS